MTGRAGLFIPAPPQTLNALCCNATMSLDDRDFSPSFVMSIGRPSLTESLAHDSNLSSAKTEIIFVLMKLD